MSSPPPVSTPVPSDRPSSRGRWSRVIQLASVATAICVLLWLLNRIGWGTIATAVKSVGWAGALLLGAIAVSESVLDGAALWTIVGGNLRLGFAVVVNCAGSVLNLVLPWESGEVLKGGLLRNYFGTQAAVSGTVIWNYIFKISRPFISGLAALTAWWLCRTVPSRTMTMILVANLFAFAPYLVLRLAIRYGAAKGFLKILRLIPGLRRHPDHWITMAHAIDDQIRQFWRDRPLDYLKVFLMQCLARTTGWMSIYTAFRLVGLPYTFAQATLIYATMNVAEYVIAIFPARVGVSEGTAYFAFQFLGLDPKMGVIVYVILRLRTVAANGILAPLAFLDWSPKLRPSPGLPEGKRTLEPLP
jgi:hypothetical protein